MTIDIDRIVAIDIQTPTGPPAYFPSQLVRCANTQLPVRTPPLRER